MMASDEGRDTIDALDVMDTASRIWLNALNSAREGNDMYRELVLELERYVEVHRDRMTEEAVREVERWISGWNDARRALASV
ncbi:MAG: hypothetical protein BWY68_00579 [bacterium ADurb.Bin400]|nr:MAG: hypothetical protein BWY68_00579 [bacterium ADurb.Bin400]